MTTTTKKCACKWPLPGRELGKLTTVVHRKGEIAGASCNDKHEINPERAGEGWKWMNV